MRGVLRSRRGQKAIGSPRPRVASEPGRFSPDALRALIAARNEASARLRARRAAALDISMRGSRTIGAVVLSGWSAGAHLTALALDHPLVAAGFCGIRCL